MVVTELTWRRRSWKILFCYLFLIYFILIVPTIDAEDDGSDYELYDIVEDINANFYELLGVDQSAEPAEIRRAYRKMSIQLHPDKNKEPDAEVKFRNLVSAYEVLKDEARRGRYNYILANGLPNWRQPVYYYRRARKMGLLEIILLLTLILTVGHFIVVWSIYFERRFEKEEVFRSRKKRERKNRRAKGGAGSTEDEMEEKLEAELQTIERPQLSGVLPIITIKALYYVVIALPGTLTSLKETLKEKFFPSQEDEFEEDSDENGGVVKRIRTKKAGPQLNALPEAYEYKHCNELSSSDNARTDSSIETRVKQKDSSDWTDEEFAALLKAVARFPGGTSNRWEKISEYVGRSVNDVTSRAKQIKTDIVRSVAPAQQGITASRLATVDPTRPTQADEDVSRRDDCPSQQITENPEVIRRRRKPIKAAERTLISADALLASSAAVKGVDNIMTTTERALEGLSWTQPQQRLLEKAMVQFPKGTDERWDRIAMLVPGKTKEDCYERYKQLVLRIKEKQTKLVTQ